MTDKRAKPDLDEIPIGQYACPSLAQPLEISDKIFRLEPSLRPWFGYYKPYPFLKRLWRWLRGRATKEYVPGIVDIRRKSIEDALNQKET